MLVKKSKCRMALNDVTFEASTKAKQRLLVVLKGLLIMWYLLAH